MLALNERTSILLIQLSLGGIWLQSAVKKLTSPEFAQNLDTTLTYFASKNPILWYKTFLIQTVIPNFSIFAQLTQWGELIAGVFLFISAVLLMRTSLKSLHSLALIGLGIGVFLNINFGLASFWISPANESLNVLMILSELVLIFFHLSHILKRPA
ncbi:hypothetical protein HY408_01970 [Candidatus Gottesmanbacteria bacterium]|nr:hypothetical protein [Candidatus Gottesmanbacteria bacterium]